MTMIVTGFASKKSLKEAVAACPQEVLITDPALMPEWRKYGEVFRASAIKIGDSVVVTNHPKRSWFAEITRIDANTVKVK